MGKLAILKIFVFLSICIFVKNYAVAQNQREVIFPFENLYQPAGSSGWYSNPPAISFGKSGRVSCLYYYPRVDIIPGVYFEIGGEPASISSSGISMSLATDVCAVSTYSESFSLSGASSVTLEYSSYIPINTNGVYENEQFGFPPTLNCMNYPPIPLGSTVTLGSATCNIRAPPGISTVKITKITVSENIFDIGAENIHFVTQLQRNSQGIPIMLVNDKIELIAMISYAVSLFSEEELNSLVEVSLKVDANVLQTKTVKISDLISEPNKQNLPFVIQLDKSFIGPKILSIEVKSNISESKISNNVYSIPVDVKVKGCKVSDIKKKNVQFFSQADTSWASEPYAFNTDPSANLQNLGCVVSSLAMLFDFYGLNRLSNNIETGSSKVLFTPVVNNQLTDPMTLNTILKGIQDLRGADSYVEGYGRNDNNPIYENVAHAGRAADQLQCYSNTKLTAPCLIDKQSCINKCIEESKSKISYIGNSKYPDGSPKNGHSRFGTTNGYLKSTATEAERNALQAEQEAAFKRIEKEICDGNPVLLRVAKERQFDNEGNEKPAAGHTVLVTESFYDEATGKLSFILNDPARKDTRFAENITLKTLQTRNDYQAYPIILGYDIYRPEKDPSMIRVSSSDNMHFVLTDTEGRRAGFDSITKTTYNEIPNAVYSYERIEPNIEPWEIFDEKLSLGSYNLFLSDDVKSGNYQVEAFGISNGMGNLSISKTDVDGFNTDTEKHSFEVFKGFQKIINFKHSDQPIPIATTDLIINYARYDQSSVKVHGELKLLNDYKINCADTIQINIGALTDFNLSLPISNFVRKTSNGQDFYEYTTSDFKITLQSGGFFWIDIFNIDLQNIQQDNKGKFAMTINSQVGRANLNLSCTNNTCYGEQRK